MRSRELKLDSQPKLEPGELYTGLTSNSVLTDYPHYGLPEGDRSHAGQDPTGFGPNREPGRKGGPCESTRTEEGWVTLGWKHPDHQKSLLLKLPLVPGLTENAMCLLWEGLCSPGLTQTPETEDPQTRARVLLRLQPRQKSSLRRAPHMPQSSSGDGVPKIARLS